VYFHFVLSGNKRKNANRLIYRLAGEAVNEGSASGAYCKTREEWGENETALLSQEGSGIAKRIPRGVVPKEPYVEVPLWNHPPHDLDCVSIVLPS
jgi:hypothetical protein